MHWPFCEALCPYCDFNSYVADWIDQTRWKNAFLAELERVFALTGPRSLTSIFFGGGTPSLMDPATVEAVIAKALSLWSARNDIEITLEANPSSIEAERFRAYQLAGINRVSIGVQALNDSDLKRLGRLHTLKEAEQAIDIARNTFYRVSFDLIYARQDQSLSDWRAELSKALSWGPDHLSLYQLTIEDGTAFGRRYAKGKLPGLPTEDLSADQYALTQQLCDTAGLPAYEVSNHAKDGAESRHNMVYWRYGDYAGIGPGAHGRLTYGGQRYATETHLTPAKWLTAAENGTGDITSSALSRQDQAEEIMLMGLRINEGVSLSRIRALGLSLESEKVNELKGLGLIQIKDDRLSATPEGRPLLNAVTTALLA